MVVGPCEDDDDDDDDDNDVVVVVLAESSGSCSFVDMMYVVVIHKMRQISPIPSTKRMVYFSIVVCVWMTRIIRL